MDLIDISELKHLKGAKVVKEVPILTDDMIATTLFFDSNIKIPPHVHPHADEVHYIIKGTGEICIGDDIKPVKAGMLFLVPRNELHCYATGEEQLIVLSIRMIGDRTRGDDIGAQDGKRSRKR